MKRIKVALLVTVLCFMESVSVSAETLYLSVAASMTDAFKELISAYSENYPDSKLRPNFASSGSLAKQINQGAPADLYVSANPKWMKFLVDNKMIDESTERNFAFNTLVFVGLPEAEVSQLKEITSLKRIGIGTPQSVPAGQYAKQAMDKAAIYQLLKNERKLVMAKDVRQALLYADRGEVDGSFVYKTDALLARSAKILFTVPEKLYNRVSYPLALTLSGSEKTEASVFYKFMATEQAIEILGKYGFEPAR